MTTASKHMARSHRSYGITKATLGQVARSSYYSRESKAVNAEKSLRVFTKLATRLKDLANRLSDGFSQNFRKQDRG